MQLNRNEPVLHRTWGDDEESVRFVFAVSDLFYFSSGGGVSLNIKKVICNLYIKTTLIFYSSLNVFLCFMRPGKI